MVMSTECALFQNTQQEWRNVFYVCAAFDLLGIIVFGMFASGEMQSWARDPKYDVEIFVDSEPEITPSAELSKTSINGLGEDKTATQEFHTSNGHFDTVMSTETTVNDKDASIAALKGHLNVSVANKETATVELR